MRITNTSRFRFAEIGAETRCSKCREWWPADSEFYYQTRDGFPQSWCKGCFNAWRRDKYQSRAMTQQPPATPHLRSST